MPASKVIQFNRYVAGGGFNPGEASGAYKIGPLSIGTTTYSASNGYYFPGGNQDGKTDPLGGSDKVNFRLCNMTGGSCHSPISIKGALYANYVISASGVKHTLSSSLADQPLLSENSQDQLTLHPQSGSSSDNCTDTICPAGVYLKMDTSFFCQSSTFDHNKNPRCSI